MAIKKHPTLYNIDSKGKVRVWRLESDGGKYRSVAGLQDGQQVTSEWKVTKAKNVGRANATTAEEQALAEVESQYKKKIEKKYSETLEEAGGVKFTECMLAAKWKDIKDKTGSWYSQPKLDGFRCLSSTGSMLSRGGKQFVSVPHIADALSALFRLNQGLILDGELYTHTLKENFDKIGSLVRKTKPTAEDIEESAKYVEYHVYDIASHNGTFDERTSVLKQMLAFLNNPYIVYVPTTLCTDEDEINEAYAEYLANGYEGQMLRNPDSLYEGGRSKNLLKRKEFFDEEYEVVSLEEGQGNWSGYAKAVYFRMPGDRRTKGGDYPKAGIKGSQEYTAKLLAGPLPKTVTVRYPNLTPEGVPRFPIAVDFQWEEGRVW